MYLPMRNHDNRYNEFTLVPHILVDDDLTTYQFSGLYDHNGDPLVRYKEIGFIPKRKNK